jgi:hypothetical protein
MNQQADPPPSRGLTLWALAAGVALVVLLGGPGAFVGEVRTAIRNGQASAPALSAARPPGYSEAQIAAVLRAAPASQPPAAPMLAGGGVGAPATVPDGTVDQPATLQDYKVDQPAADPLACVNGKTPRGIDCEILADGTHYYPPATTAPCSQADGQVRFSRILPNGNTEVFTLTPAWSSDRSTFTVTLPGASAPALFVGPVPACGQ